MKRLLTAITLLTLMVLPATAAETVDVVWMEQEVDVTFISLDIAYSCDLVQSRIEMLLRHVGAEAIHVAVPSCGGFKSPQTHHRILAGFSTLVPASVDDVDVVKAEWSEVELGKGQPRSIDDGDCELLEFFQRYLLPTVAHEVIEGKTECGATRRSIAGRLKLKVLGPVAEDGEAPKGE